MSHQDWEQVTFTVKKKQEIPKQIQQEPKQLIPPKKILFTSVSTLEKNFGSILEFLLDSIAFPPYSAGFSP